MKIALCQIDTTIGDLEGNARKILAAAKLAQQKNARLAIFPEMTLTGYPLEDLALRNSFQTSTEIMLQKLLIRTIEEELQDMYLVVGTFGARRNAEQFHYHKPTNRAVVIHGGEVIAGYDKHFLPNYGVFDEYRIFSPGKKETVFEVDGLKIGLLICEDIWNQGGTVERLKTHDIDLAVVINASPFEVNKSKTRLKVVQDVGKRLGAKVAYVNLVGSTDDLVFDGESFVIDENGAMMNVPTFFGETIEVVNLDTQMRYANKNSNLVENYALSAPPSSVDLINLDEMDTGYIKEDEHNMVVPVQEQVYRACVLGLQGYAEKNGFNSVVLGLSGGIDSALVATIAKDALGGENVLGILMPSKYSSKGSIDDAVQLAENLGCKYVTHSIETEYNSYEKDLDMSDLAKENIQARIRGNIIMAYSNSFGHLALATGNKSELAVGYSTIYGDAVGGYAPIKDVNKTMVFSIAKWRNKIAIENGEIPPIPQNSITKPPSAELRPDQKDQDSLPDYEVLDDILEQYIEMMHGRTELVDAGFDPKLVDKVVRMVDTAEWKRRQYPIGPKVTTLAFGRDRRLPITNHFMN
jgi:NAD+ synthase (glutamine-hydrolysing)